MIKMTVNIQNNIQFALAKQQKQLKELPKKAFQKFHDITPEDKGNAKRNTRLRGKSIQANYPYAEVLDKGRHMTNRGMRGSTQAPEGMTKPTTDFIIEEFYKIMLGK